MLKIQSDRVIIDGHEPTKEQCETMTLLANAIAESDNFETVEYRDGYAEFERVGHTEELKFWNTDLIAGTLNGETFNISAVSTSTSESVDISASISTTGLQVTFSGTVGGRVTINGNNAENYFVPWDNTIEYSAGDTANLEFKSGVQLLSTPGALDNGFAITLSAPSKLSVDLTTLPGWEALSSGTHNITIVAKANGYRDSAPSAAVQVEKAPAVVMPVKGDIITMDAKQYRVLKVNGSVAEVLCMYDANNSIRFDTNLSYNNTYEGKNIDTYCNDTFYSGLSAAMKSAIVDKTFTQDSWTRASSVPTGSHYTGKYGSSTYYVTLANATFGASITRHCYCLSVQDVLDYLEATTSMGTSDTTLTDTNIWKMFWNVTTSQVDKFIWLRSADSSYSNRAFYVHGNYGYLADYGTGSLFAARPAFQIDLSKISWSK